MFRIIVPLDENYSYDFELVNGAGYDTREKGGIQGAMQDTIQDTIQDAIQNTTKERKETELLKFCEVVARSREEMQLHIGITNRDHFFKGYLKPLLKSGKLKRTIPDKPSSKNQRYIKG